MDNIESGVLGNGSIGSYNDIVSFDEDYVPRELQEDGSQIPPAPL